MSHASCSFQHTRDNLHLIRDLKKVSYLVVLETRIRKSMLIEVKGTTICLHLLGGSPEGACYDGYNAT
jgi:hypothetical protein